MANEFLNKARDAAGSVIYTASTEDTDGKPTTRVEFKTPQPVQLSGSNVQQTKTQADAVSGVVNFLEKHSRIEIYNTSNTDGVFNVNGIDIIIPVERPFSEQIGGTPRATVNVKRCYVICIGRYE